MKKWEQATNSLVENWIRKYFEVSDKESLDYFWVCDEVGGVFCFADFFFDLQTVLTCYRFDVSKDVLFSWYDSQTSLSLADVVRPPRKINKKHLQKLEKRIRFAKKTL